MTTFQKMFGITTICIGVLFAKQYYGGTYCKVTRNLTGQVAIITGGNTGIGKQTAFGLAEKGCQVIIAARDVHKSLETVEQIKKKTKNEKVHFIPLDLGSKDSIDDFAEQVQSKYKEIDILVNNAGVMGIPERRETVDKFQMHFGINHLGHFYLTSRLWDLMKKSKQLRIVNVSSQSHRRVAFDRSKVVDLDWNNLNFDYDYDSGLAYSRSKLANVLFTQQLARRLDSVLPNARCVSLHPGVVRTQIGRYAFEGPRSLIPIVLYPFMQVFLKSPFQGAQTTLYTVLQKSENLVNGQYYDQCQVSNNKNPFVKDLDNQKILWKLSQKMLGRQFNL